MDADDLTQALDELATDEHMAFETWELKGYPDDVADADIESRLAALARGLSARSLDQLEQQPGYAAWALRLSPHVPGDDPRARARRHVKSPDAVARRWAAQILAGAYPRSSSPG